MYLYLACFLINIHDEAQFTNSGASFHILIGSGSWSMKNHMETIFLADNFSYEIVKHGNVKVQYKHGFVKRIPNIRCWSYFTDT
jgi:hypothetical protein